MDGGSSNIQNIIICVYCNMNGYMFQYFCASCGRVVSDRIDRMKDDCEIYFSAASFSFPLVAFGFLHVYKYNVGKAMIDYLWTLALC